MRFSAALGTLFETPHRLLLEVGPSQNLSTSARQHRAPGRSFEVVPDNAALAARGVTLEALQRALEANNRNDGAGRLQDASVLLPADADASFDVVLVDVNGDNALDLFVANLRAVQRLYLNSGNGVFTDATANLSATNTGGDSFSMTVGDFNADRAVDVLFVRRQATPWLFLNTPR